MAGNVLGLCFLVLGTTGIVNAIYFDEGNGWNQRYEHPSEMPSNKIWNYPNQLGPLYLKYRRLSHLGYVYKPSDYKIDMKNITESRQPLNLHSAQFLYRLSRLKKVSILTIPEMKENKDEALVTVASNSLDKNTINYARDGTDEIRDYSYSDIEPVAREADSMIKMRETPSDKSENTILSNTDSTSFISSAPQVSLHQGFDKQNVSVSKNSSESNPVMTSATTLSSDTSLIAKKTIKETSGSTSSTLNPKSKPSVTENTLPTENENIFSTQTLENSTDVDASANASSFYTTKTSDENETSEINSSLGPDSTTSKIQLSTDSSLSHTTGNPTDGSTFSKVSSDISVSYGTTPETKETSENTPLYTESSSLIETQSTNSQISEKESTATSNPITSTTGEDASISLTSKIAKETTEDISSTLSSAESVSSKSELTTEVISEDHVIRISSIRTARVVVSVVFLVIALIAVTVLAIYIFRVKRRAVQYDELLLLP